MDYLFNFLFTIHLENTNYIKYSMFRAQRRLIVPIFGSKVTFVLQIVKSKMKIIPTFQFSQVLQSNLEELEIAIFFDNSQLCQHKKMLMEGQEMCNHAFLMEKLLKVMQNCMHNFEKYFFTKSTKLEKENLNVFAHISGLR